MTTTGRSFAAATLALLCAGPPRAHGLDPEGERVVARVVDHYRRIKSMRIAAVLRDLRFGAGLHAEGTEPTAGDYRTDGEVRELEHWSAPPKLRRIERVTRDGVQREPFRLFFDGEASTRLDDGGLAVVERGGNAVDPLVSSPLHAVGFCYPFAFQGSFADLLAERDKVTARRVDDVAGRAVWLLEIKPLPDGIRPKFCEANNRRDSLTRLWVSVDPDVVVWRWGEYEYRRLPPPPSNKPEPPAFALKGYHLVRGFSNRQFRAVKDESNGGTVLMPMRVVGGNTSGSGEYEIREVAVNPAERADSFRPAVPAGYVVHTKGETADGSKAAAGGEAVRVAEISRRAKELLADDVNTRAPEGRRDWLLPAACMSSALAGVFATMSWLRQRRHRP